jgi:hypothetical protein
MRKLTICIAAAIPLAVGGLVYAASFSRNVNKDATPVGQSGYVCPITGEHLPCPNCCPLNQKN